MKLVVVILLLSIVPIISASPHGVISLPLKYTKRSIEKRDQGNLHTFKHDWWAEVSLGTPPQKSNMLIDTGSSNVWAYSKSCGTDECFLNFKGTNRFNQFISTSFEPAGNRVFDMTYGGGTGIAYQIGSDIVEIAGIRIDKQQIGTTTNLVNRQIDFDGIVGLGRDKNTNPSFLATPTATMFKQKLIKSNMFSLDLKSFADGGGGELLFGGIDYSKIEGDLVCVPTASDDEWSVEYTTICVGSVDIKRSAPEAVLDTGSDSIYTSCGTAEAIYNEIPGSRLHKTGDWIVPCELPDHVYVAYEIGNVKWRIPAKDLVTGPVAGVEDYCIGAIQVDELPFDILGAPFLKQYYTVFDSENQKICLAKKKQ
ncbi:2536_t:CDS:2 [Paraglomus occultum]|uniref:2536_t:CDS:1 n=1 Tax=Paraglomus occultum TaxID=144539 RepID=A0A9N9BV43_9GLOM|nr:2536_t:CDS:2 [Paraglomus occultum]